MTLGPASPPAEREEIRTAQQFNLWCALNNQPYKLATHVWPDGRREWGLEHLPGRADGGVCYGVGVEDEAMAVVAGFAFVAGAEWGDSRARIAAEEAALGDADDEEDDADADDEAPTINHSHLVQRLNRLEMELALLRPSRPPPSAAPALTTLETISNSVADAAADPAGEDQDGDDQDGFGDEDADGAALDALTDDPFADDVDGLDDLDEGDVDAPKARATMFAAPPGPPPAAAALRAILAPRPAAVAPTPAVAPVAAPAPQPDAPQPTAPIAAAPIAPAPTASAPSAAPTAALDPAAALVASFAGPALANAAHLIAPLLAPPRASLTAALSLAPVASAPAPTAMEGDDEDAPLTLTRALPPTPQPVASPSAASVQAAVLANPAAESAFDIPPPPSLAQRLTPRPSILRPAPRPAATPPAAPKTLPSNVGADAALTQALEIPGYALPPVDLLRSPPPDRTNGVDEITTQENARLLESVLQDFGVRGDIVKVRPGPVVTLYELEPAPGTKASRVIGLAEDIARSMSAVAVRIAVVPGRSVIGIELPNPRREIVYLREMLEAPEYEASEHRLPLILGKDIGGAPVMVDLARMPHLLIAGTTGSGKSVGINTMILSLLFRLPPDKCRFIMVDPKMLELSVYDGVPHLLSPVVTDPKKAVVALKWAVREMENRYRAMAQLGVRNIEGYNARILELAGDPDEDELESYSLDGLENAPLFEGRQQTPKPLPYIVVVVDEMADLMLVAGKEIEASIQRLAQMARAAGIHLIMATQRPSVDVITGVVKANFPSRISFQVTSKIDSRTILGEGGAEQLLGQGDMLAMAGGGRLARVHGPFVSDGEVEAVVTHLKMQGRPVYVDAVTADEEEEAADAAAEGDAAAASGPEVDELFDQAVELVAREQKASTSFIQRHLQIGYNRAARLMDRMEADGMVGPPNHVGRREVFMPRRGAFGEQR